MTAEIAIINKTAVALAADSAVTISNGDTQEKIYESADKLFELFCGQPVAIMINNDMQFFETPLPVLINRYRERLKQTFAVHGVFDHIREYASDFQNYLHEFAKSSPDLIKQRHLRAHIEPLVAEIERRSAEAIGEFLSDRKGMSTETRPFGEIVTEILDREIAVMAARLKALTDVNLVGSLKVEISAVDKKMIAKVVSEELPIANASQRSAVVELIQANLTKAFDSPVTTGVVIAGFGAKELFPTLVSFDLFGQIGGALRVSNYQIYDIDRAGVRAAVLPFAQREMVSRFLYGLDDATQGHIADSYGALLDQVCTSLASGNRKAKSAAKKAIDDAVQELFDDLREGSRQAVEDMVEFMPKSELAQMAEALVNLTSIKRRVSRGMATVGGPIDVAVISRSEGFVWIKQKHYFPGILNPGYFSRIDSESRFGQELSNEPS
jgi:hypothetical protein